VRPRIRRRLRVIALGLVLLPTLALALLVRAIAEADREARQHEVRERRERVQGRAEDLAARLAARGAIFPAEDPEPLALSEALEPLVLSQPVEVDGDCSDWRVAGLFESSPCETARVAFDRAELVSGDVAGWSPDDLSFGVLEGTREEEGYRYLFLRVVDDDFRPRRGRRLEAGDQLRLVARLPWGADATIPARFVTTFEPDGALTTYQVDASWQRDVPAEERHVWGNYQAPVYRRPYGVWRRTARGYDVELRLPLRVLGERGPEVRLGLAVVDVDGPAPGSEALRRKALWVVPQRPGTLALAAPGTRDFQRAWTQLGLELRGRQLAVLDARGRELFASFANSGTQPGAATAAEPAVGSAPLRDRAAALLATLRRGGESSLVDAQAPLAAARVVSDGGSLLGFVVEQDAGEVVRPRVLAVVRESPVLAAMFSGALLLLFVLLWDTRRLSRRILALVDDMGADRGADDEIGELSRRLCDLVERVRADRSYLERLPAILGHETLGPLGVVKMYLDDLDAPDRKGRYDAARRALRAIEELIDDLREVTSLEEALARGERCQVDLVAFLGDYLLAYGDANHAPIQVELPTGRFLATVIEGRVEQLLDKLLDNAVEFAEEGPVRVALVCSDGLARIRVENTGPPLPEGPGAGQLFEPMWSARKRTSERHLGMGLYVARIIARHLGGEIRAWNAEGRRVVFEVVLREAAWR
jgi:two-component system, OmpR family, sensor histidine kinase ChvG